MDIKPNSDPNSLNIGRPGLVAVALLSTPDLDTTTMVDPSTIRWGPTGTEAVAVRCGDPEEEISGGCRIDGSCDRHVGMTTTPKPIPDTYPRVNPVLVVQGADKALEFYAEVFGATERMRIPGPGGTVAHAEIAIGDSVVMVEDESPAMGTKAPPSGGFDGSPNVLFVYVEDVDAVIERAEQLGATVKRPASDQFYGDRDGFIVDPFGHGWTVATHVEDVAPDELMRRFDELMKGAGS